MVSRRHGSSDPRTQEWRCGSRNGFRRHRRPTMYGASIELDFPHIAFEQEQLRREFEMRRLFDANQPQAQRPRRSVADIFGRLTPRFTLRSLDRPSPVSLSAFVGFIMLFSALM